MELSLEIIEKLAQLAIKHDLTMLGLDGLRIQRRSGTSSTPSEGDKGPEEKIPTEEDFLYHSTGIRFEPVNPPTPEKP